MPVEITSEMVERAMRKLIPCPSPAQVAEALDAALNDETPLPSALAMFPRLAELNSN